MGTTSELIASELEAIVPEDVERRMEGVGAEPAGFIGGGWAELSICAEGRWTLLGMVS